MCMECIINWNEQFMADGKPDECARNGDGDIITKENAYEKIHHVAKFHRFDFTQNPAIVDERIVHFEFPEVTDDNIGEYDKAMWKALMALPGTGVTGHFSSWTRM